MGNQARVELLCCGCEFYPLISCLLELKYSEQLLEESNAFWNMLMDEIISQGKRSRERISIWSFYLISRVDVHTWVDSWTAESQIKTWKCDILTLIIYCFFENREKIRVFKCISCAFLLTLDIAKVMKNVFIFLLGKSQMILTFLKSNSTLDAFWFFTMKASSCGFFGKVRN